MPSSLVEGSFGGKSRCSHVEAESPSRGEGVSSLVIGCVQKTQQRPEWSGDRAEHDGSMISDGDSIDPWTDQISDFTTEFDGFQLDDEVGDRMQTEQPTDLDFVKAETFDGPIEELACFFEVTVSPSADPEHRSRRHLIEDVGMFGGQSSCEGSIVGEFPGSPEENCQCRPTAGNFEVDFDLRCFGRRFGDVGRSSVELLSERAKAGRQPVQRMSSESAHGRVDFGRDHVERTSIASLQMIDGQPASEFDPFGTTAETIGEFDGDQSALGSLRQEVRSSMDRPPGREGFEESVRITRPVGPFEGFTREIMSESCADRVRPLNTVLSSEWSHGEQIVGIDVLDHPVDTRTDPNLGRQEARSLCIGQSTDVEHVIDERGRLSGSDPKVATFGVVNGGFDSQMSTRGTRRFSDDDFEFSACFESVTLAAE